MEIPAKNNKEASTLAISNCERLVAAKEVSMAWLVLDVKLTLSLPKF